MKQTDRRPNDNKDKIKRNKQQQTKARNKKIHRREMKKVEDTEIHTT